VLSAGPSERVSGSCVGILPARLSTDAVFGFTGSISLAVVVLVNAGMLSDGHCGRVDRPCVGLAPACLITDAVFGFTGSISLADVVVALETPN
jgi:hypothetical protein